jgi:hypothetical protein
MKRYKPKKKNATTHAAETVTRIADLPTTT